MKINQEAMLTRMETVLDTLEQQIKLPMYMHSILPVLKTQLPALNETQRQDIMNVLQLIGWAMGYTVTYTEDEKIMDMTGEQGDELI